MTNVEILDGHELVGLTTTAQGDRVTGANVVGRDGAVETSLEADLVIDATGRGSRTPALLKALGYSRPREDELVVRMAYTSQRLRIPAPAPTEGLFIVYPEPGRLETFAMLGCEDDTWMLTMSSMMGHASPSGREEMLQSAQDFAPVDAVAAVRGSVPLGEVAHYRIPSNRWRRYDKMRQTPQGLLVVGDAVCSFNPIYGQGMTMAAIEAMILRECLHRGDRDLPRRFFRASAKKLVVAWQTAVGSDLALPEVVGPRPVSMRMTNAYMERVLTAAETDPVVVEQFLRVVGMIDSPARLLHPSVVLRIARARRGRQAKPALSETSERSMKRR
jgi:2-polyprenyl-6-methoxyphenol hydroxylase-like FAD-dependent oxidoreductase